MAEKLSVDQWVAAEKARLTVFARHCRFMGANLEANRVTAIQWRAAFAAHQRKANAKRFPVQVKFYGQFGVKETK